jgi:23S rRNA (cytosine1962-C5)-methyltransferase
MKNHDLSVRPWKDYELLDSGDGQKLERYGEVIVIRPETQALWKKLRPELWSNAHAEFRWADGKGSWVAKGIPEQWDISWNSVRFVLRLTSFKHTGIFPEQAANWEWITERVSSLKQSSGHNDNDDIAAPKVLNLFGYTGIASVVAAKYGANVTHCDASKQSNMWARENATLSEIPDDRIRYILDDAVKFAEREVRRGAVYDGIILDPPAFGRGAKGEVFKIEEDLPKLLESTHKLLAKKAGAFFLLNGYAAGYAPQSFLHAVESAFPEDTKANGEFGELHINESSSDRSIASGIYVRFAR